MISEELAGAVVDEGESDEEGRDKTVTAEDFTDIAEVRH